MLTDISEFQKKRAENIIWNCARSYEFTPDFKAYDENGIADLYWNCIIGAVRRHYDYPRIESILRAFQQYDEDCETYEWLMWIGLENCVFAREVKDRQVLAHLRQQYAAEYYKRFGKNAASVVRDDYRLLDALSLAHWMRVLGLEVKMSRYDISLLDELEFPPDADTDYIVEKAAQLFRHWFMITTEEHKKEKVLHMMIYLKY